jgi:putative redox protein
MEMEMFFPGGKKVGARYKGYTVVTDQPEKSGGGGSAPAPFDLFMLSIGTCGAYYVMAFCQARNIPLDEIRVTMTAVRDQEKKMIARMDLRVVLPADFPEKYLKAVAHSAKACAVVKHLEDAPAVEVQIVRE